MYMNEDQRKGLGGKLKGNSHESKSEKDKKGILVL